MILMRYTAYLSSASFSILLTFFPFGHIFVDFTLCTVCICDCVICFLVLLLVFFCFAGVAR